MAPPSSHREAVTDPTDPTESAPSALDPEAPTDGDAPDAVEGRDDNNRTLIIVLIVVIVALAAALLFALASDDDGDEVVTADTTSTSEEASSTSETSEPSSTTSSTPVSTPSDAELDTVVWPGPDAGVLYTSPVAAATGFATDLAGFTDPLVGEFMQGDSRSGEIEIRGRETGQITTVLVRQLSDDNWWVLGALTPLIDLETPEAGATVANPAQLSGRSSAFEAAVDVSIFDLGGTTPLGTGIVMGGGGAELEPFSGEVGYDDPAGRRGVVMLFTVSTEDGSVDEAVAVPVVFSEA